MKHPLILAIELRDKAIRRKSHSNIISKLEKRVTEEAKKVNKKLGGNAVAVFNKIAGDL